MNFVIYKILHKSPRQYVQTRHKVSGQFEMFRILFAFKSLIFNAATPLKCCYGQLGVRNGVGSTWTTTWGYFRTMSTFVYRCFEEILLLT